MFTILNRFTNECKTVNVWYYYDRYFDGSLGSSTGGATLSKPSKAIAGPASASLSVSLRLFRLSHTRRRRQC